MWKPLKQETIQALLSEARYLDEKPHHKHRMDSWSCGTTSCAVGDMMHRGDCGLKWMHDQDWGTDVPLFGDKLGFYAVTNALGIGIREAEFLFCYYTFGDRKHESPSSTAARIRKYLYYRMRKAEILADYESARRVEGNLNVCQQAVEYAGAK